MAENENGSGWLSRAKSATKRFLGLAGGAGEGDTADIMRADGAYNYDAVSVSMLLGSARRQARSRIDIYTKYHYMAGDPVISTALRAHVTMALGGHETSGDTVFIEATATDGKDQGRAKIVQDLQVKLAPLFNRVAHQVAFNATAFGDSYARVYVRDKEGLVDLYTDEMVFPPLVQPYEKGNTTVGYVVSTGRKFTEKLTIKQMVRVRMPRMLYTPQVRVVEKAMQANIVEDDIEQLPLLPALVGGSFLEAAEEAYDNLTRTLAGLINQRILQGIDESMISANLDGMTLEQRKMFMESFKKMLIASKERAADLTKDGKYSAERTYNIIPTFAEKQLSSIVQFTGTSGASSVSVDDVMFHAKMLAGALGIDLSMLGFADILSGGLGEGGFFRTSAQAAERSRIIRTSLSQFFDDLVDLHTLAKYGWVFEDGDRPYRINFYGSISALENEQQASRERAMQASSLLLQGLEQLRNLDLGPKVNQQLLEKHMEMDGDLAKVIATEIEKKPPPDEGGGGFGGGFNG